MLQFYLFRQYVEIRPYGYSQELYIQKTLVFATYHNLNQTVAELATNLLNKF